MWIYLNKKRLTEQAEKVELLLFNQDTWIDLGTISAPDSIYCCLSCDCRQSRKNDYPSCI